MDHLYTFGTPWEQRRDIAPHLLYASLPSERTCFCLCECVCGRMFVCALVVIYLCLLLFVFLCGLAFMPTHCILSSVQLEPFYYGISHHLCLSSRELLTYCSSVTEHRQPEQSTFAYIWLPNQMNIEFAGSSSLSLDIDEWSGAVH